VSYDIAVTYLATVLVFSDVDRTGSKVLNKRFSDFRSLQKELSEQIVDVPVLPGQAWLAVTHKAKFDANRLHIKQGQPRSVAECMKSPTIVQHPQNPKTPQKINQQIMRAWRERSSR